MLLIDGLPCEARSTSADGSYNNSAERQRFRRSGYAKTRQVAYPFLVLRMITNG